MHYMASPAIPAGFDLTDPDMNRRGLPVAELAELRGAAPIWWNAQPTCEAFGDTGHWVVSRHHDV